MLKFTNAEKTAAEFDGGAFEMAGPEDWNSIGSGPTREAVLAWLSAGNQPEAFPDLSNEQLKARLTTNIDSEVAAIYSRYTRFQGEYELREAQAQAFKDAGYTGEVPPQVAAFATPAGLDAQSATDTILSQAENLRGALAQLGVLRMRKYEVINAADLPTAQAKHNEIIGAITAIGSALS